MINRILHVPTHIIAGFLGVGKTTAILHLFEQKPANEKWAVLVNEFGEMGIDRHFYQAQGIHVEEIPGGCMCCAQSLPLQVGVNRLLKSVRPDRLIVETSGVGHPQGIIKTFTGEHFKQSLDLKAVISLLNPEYLLNEKYLKNGLFRQQVEVADILVANKTDLASETALMAFDQLISNQKKQALSVKVTEGKISLSLLNQDRALQHPVFKLAEVGTSQIHWQTYTHQFERSDVIDAEQLVTQASSLPFERLKGLIQSSQGLLLINGVDGQISYDVIQEDLNKQQNNYLEVIAQQIDQSQWQSVLSHCKVQS